MEMTGLEPARERLIEMATILTDGNLIEIAVGPGLVIHQSDEILAAMTGIPSTTVARDSSIASRSRP